MNLRAIELRIALAAFALAAVAFVAFPEIDLAASGLFFRNGEWLLSPYSAWLALPYYGMPRVGQAIVLTLLVLTPLSFLPRLTRLRPHRGTLAFLLCAALIGPIGLVDAVLKEHSGRARPINVQLFGGDKVFTPAFIPADQCRKNCAFVSGHVASASFFMAFGWLAAPRTRRRWLIGGAACAGFMTVVRMLPGGHFLSDALFAWFIVYFTLWAVEWAFRKLGWLPASSPSAEPSASGTT